MNTYKNYIEQANISTFSRISKKEVVEKVMEDCRSLFWSALSPLHFIVEQEFLKIYDYYDEHHLMKFKIKTYMTEIKKEFDKYQEWIEENYESKAFAVPFDLANNIYGAVQKEILDLYLTFKFYFERKGIDTKEPNVQIQTTLALFDCYEDIFDNFFEKFRREYHINFIGYLCGESIKSFL